MTLGVAGTGFEDDRDMVKGGSEGIRMAPVSIRCKLGRPKSQLEEWRCLSLREARILAVGYAGATASVSSGRGGREAEQNCAAWLEKDMMLSGAPSRGTSTCGVEMFGDDGGVSDEKKVGISGSALLSRRDGSGGVDHMQAQSIIYTLPN